MKIEMSKQYKTREGKDVRVLCVDRDGEYPVIGLVGSDIRIFTETGLACHSDVLDLIEVSPFEDFKDGDPVMVRENDKCGWIRHYFSHAHESLTNLGGYTAYTYAAGATKWSGKVVSDWNQCRRPTAEELQ